MAIRRTRDKRQSGEDQIILSLSDQSRLAELVSFLISHNVQASILTEGGVTRILVNPDHQAIITDVLIPWWDNKPGLVITGLGNDQ